MQRVRRKEPQALGAWECAMRAQWHLARLTREDLAEAHRLAAQATALDPGTTLGFNIAAFTHIHEVTDGWSTIAAAVGAGRISSGEQGGGAGFA